MTVRTAVLNVLALPSVLVGYLFVLLLCLFWIAEWKTLRFQEGGVLVARTREWAAKYWRFSTTIGNGILYHPNHYTGEFRPLVRIERHEMVHVRQFQDDCVRFLVASVALVFVTTNLWFFLVWPFGMLAMLPNFLTALLRYGKYGLYYDSEHERSAYAQTDESWDIGRDIRRDAQTKIF